MRKLIYSMFLALSATFLCTGCGEEEPVSLEKFKVTFDSKGGSTVSEITIEKGEKITKPTNPTNGEYLFVDWFREEGYINKWDFDKDVVESNMTLYAKWTTVTYTVTFDTNGGNTIEPITVAKGSAAVKPVPPTKNDAAFDNWYKEAALTNVYDFSTPVTANITIYAKWTTVTRETLTKLVDEAQNINSSNYTHESYEAMNVKRSAARNVLENASSTSAQIITAYTELSAAMAALKALPKREVAGIEVQKLIDNIVYINKDQEGFTLNARAIDAGGDPATNYRVTFEYDAAKLAAWVEGEIHEEDYNENNSISFMLKSTIAAGQTIDLTVKSVDNPAISKAITLKVTGKEDLKTMFINAANALPAPNKITYENYEAIQKAEKLFYALSYEIQQESAVKVAYEKVSKCDDAYWDLPVRIKYTFNGNICTMTGLTGASKTEYIGKFTYANNGAFPAGTYTPNEWIVDGSVFYQMRIIVNSDNTGKTQEREADDANGTGVNEWGDDEPFTYTYQGTQAAGGMFFLTFLNEDNKEVLSSPVNPTRSSVKTTTVRSIFNR